MEHDLFSDNAQKTIIETEFEVVATPRTVFDYWITIDGKKFDAEDLFNCLAEVKCGDVVLSDQKMIAMLKKLRVINYEGNHRWCSGAEKGANFDVFYEKLHAAYYKARKD